MKLWLAQLVTRAGVRLYSRKLIWLGLRLSGITATDVRISDAPPEVSLGAELWRGGKHYTYDFDSKQWRRDP